MKREDLLNEIGKIVDERVKSHQEEVRNESQGEMKNFIREVMESRSTKEQGDAALGQGFARMVRALAAAKGDTNRASEWANEKFKDDIVAKALATSPLDAGGAFVPEEMSSEVIELLRPRSVMRRMNPQVVPMTSGMMNIPKLTGGATAEWVGENTSQNASQQKTGSVRLVWKKLRATVPVSNELLAFASPQVDEIVRNDAVEALATEQDKAFIRSEGSENSPQGVRYWADSNNVTSTNGTTLDNIDTDLLELINGLQENNVRFLRPGILTSVREYNNLRVRRNSNGDPAYPDFRANNTLFQIPVEQTTNIPANLGGGSDESEVYLIDFADVVIGEGTGLQIEVSNQATYTDSNGSLVSAFDQDQTVVKVIQRLDLVVRHAESIAVKTGVKWGTTTSAT